MLMEDERVCFVCAEGGPGLLSNVCACRSYVHLKCQQQLINRVPAYLDGTCPVCREPYTNVRRRFTARAVCRSALLSSTCAVLALVSMYSLVALSSEWAGGAGHAHTTPTRDNDAHRDQHTLSMPYDLTTVSAGLGPALYAHYATNAEPITARELYFDRGLLPVLLLVVAAAGATLSALESDGHGEAGSACVAPEVTVSVHGATLVDDDAPPAPPTSAPPPSAPPPPYAPLPTSALPQPRANDADCRAIHADQYRRAERARGRRTPGRARIAAAGPGASLLSARPACGSSATACGGDVTQSADALTTMV